MEKQVGEVITKTRPQIVISEPKKRDLWDTVVDQLHDVAGRLNLDSGTLAILSQPERELDPFFEAPEPQYRAPDTDPMLLEFQRGQVFDVLRCTRGADAHGCVAGQPLPGGDQGTGASEGRASPGWRAGQGARCQVERAYSEEEVGRWCEGASEDPSQRPRRPRRGNGFPPGGAAFVAV